MHLPLRKEKKIAIIKAHRTDFCVFMTYAGLKGAHIIHKSQGSPGTKLNGIDGVLYVLLTLYVGPSCACA